ncbi:MAG: recombinase family protein [Clostridia bacterium]|nr:recombinase family protein [Clostridia bacterium]
MAEKRIPTAVYCRADDVYGLGLAQAFLSHYKEFELLKRYEDLTQLIMEANAGFFECIVVSNKTTGGIIAANTRTFVVSADGRYMSRHEDISIELIDWQDYERRQKYLSDIEARKEQGRKISEGIQDRVERGETLSNVPYGYLKEDGKLIIDPEAAPVVRQIFAWAKEGVPNADIGVRLDKQGISPPKGGDHWIGTSIRGMLENPTYCGVYPLGVIKRGLDRKVRKGEPVYYEDHHEPIIDWDTFNAVKEVLEGRSTKAIREANKEGSEPDDFGEKARCAVCDYKLDFRRKTAGNKIKASYYHCENHTGKNPKSEPLEKQPKITADDLKKLVMDKCNIHILLASFIARNYDLLATDFDGQEVEVRERITTLGTELSKLALDEQYSGKAESIVANYPDLYAELRRIQDSRLEAELLYTQITVNYGDNPMELYMTEFDKEKADRVYTKVLLKPDGGIDVKFKVDWS